MSDEFLIGGAPLFRDRREAGEALAAELEEERGPELVVVGLARGGVQVAAEVARALSAPLDVVAVRKIGHPLQPEYGIGAVTPGDGVYVRGPDGLSEEELAAVVEETKVKAELLNQRLHAEEPSLDLRGKTALVVDDGLATGDDDRSPSLGGGGRAARVVAAVPVAAAESLALIRAEADEVVCLHALEPFFAVGVWYESFTQVGDGEVVQLVGENRREHEPDARPAASRRGSM